MLKFLPNIAQRKYLQIRHDKFSLKHLNILRQKHVVNIEYYYQIHSGLYKASLKIVIIE